jgi:hypothetical protein
MTKLLQRLTRSLYNPPAATDSAVNSVTSGRLWLGRFALVVVTLSIFLPWPGDASAQRKRIVFDDDEEGSKVEGYVHRPEVGYIISRQEQEDLETLQLKESFLPKVIKSVEKRPF